jgi:hypothetical protein
MDADTMSKTYAVTPEKAAVLVAIRRYVSADYWAKLMVQLEGMRR